MPSHLLRGPAPAADSTRGSGHDPATRLRQSRFILSVIAVQSSILRAGQGSTVPLSAPVYRIVIGDGRPDRSGLVNALILPRSGGGNNLRGEGAREPATNCTNDTKEGKREGGGRATYYPSYPTIPAFWVCCLVVMLTFGGEAATSWRSPITRGQNCTKGGTRGATIALLHCPWVCCQIECCCKLSIPVCFFGMCERAGVRASAPWGLPLRLVGGCAISRSRASW